MGASWGELIAALTVPATLVWLFLRCARAPLQVDAGAAAGAWHHRMAAQPRDRRSRHSSPVSHVFTIVLHCSTVSPLLVLPTDAFTGGTPSPSSPFRVCPRGCSPSHRADTARHMLGSGAGVCAGPGLPRRSGGGDTRCPAARMAGTNLAALARYAVVARPGSPELHGNASRRVHAHFRRRRVRSPSPKPSSL